MLTNEQSVLEVEQKITSLKEEYIKILSPIATKYHSDKKTINLGDFLKCQQLGNNYFNHVEQLVGDSGLLGAHNNGKWVTGFAETCHSVLIACIEHIKFLRSWKESIGEQINIEPNPNAYANMQRMVVEYLPKQAEELKKKFEEYNLPTNGFNSKGASDMKKTPVWKEIVAVLIGVLGMVVILFFAFKTPYPTNSQIFFFRGAFSLCSSMLATLIPGFLNVESRISELSITATGAIAIFVITWLINPPALIQ